MVDDDRRGAVQVERRTREDDGIPDAEQDTRQCRREDGGNIDEAFQGAGSNLEGIEKTLDAIREVFLKDDVFHRRFFGLVAKGFVDESSAREMRLLMDKIGYKIEKCLAEVMGDTREFIVPLNHFSRILRAMFDGLALQVLVDPDFDIDATFESVKKIILALYSEHVRQWPATQR